MERLVIEEDTVYEIDEDCLRRKEEEEETKAGARKGKSHESRKNREHIAP